MSFDDAQAQIAGIPATSGRLNGSFVLVSSEVDFSVSGPIRLAFDCGQVFSQSDFQYLPNPTVSSVYPLTAPCGSSLEVRGEGFNSSGVAPVVSVAGTFCQVGLFNDSYLQCILGDGEDSGPVRLQIDSAFSEARDSFKYAPLVRKLWPKRAVRGHPTTIRLNGSNLGMHDMGVFLSNEICSVLTRSRGLVECEIVAPHSSNSSNTNLSSHDSSIGKGRLHHQNTQYDMGFGFEFVERPRILSFLPNKSPVSGGSQVRIVTSEIPDDEHIDQIRMHGVIPRAIVREGPFITVTTRARAVSHSKRSVVDEAPTPQIELPLSYYTVHSEASFNYVDDPVVVNFEPRRGSAGVIVQLKGTSMDAGVANVSVHGMACRIFDETLNNETSLSCVIEENVHGQGPVSLTIGDAFTSPVHNFSFLDRPIALYSFHPTKASKRGGMNLAIRGIGFERFAYQRVHVIGQVCDIVHSQDDLLVCTLRPCLNGSQFCAADRFPKGHVVVTLDEMPYLADGTFAYADGPEIQSFAPARGPLSGGTRVNITVDMLPSWPVTVLIAGVAVRDSDVAVVGNRTLQVRTPRVGNLTTDVVELVPQQLGLPRITSILNFTFMPDPVLARFSPQQGRKDTQVTLFGTGLAVGLESQVTIGDIECHVVHVLDTLLVCRLASNLLTAAPVCLRADDSVTCSRDHFQPELDDVLVRSYYLVIILPILFVLAAAAAIVLLLLYLRQRRRPPIKRRQPLESLANVASLVYAHFEKATISKGTTSFEIDHIEALLDRVLLTRDFAIFDVIRRRFVNPQFDAVCLYLYAKGRLLEVYDAYAIVEGKTVGVKTRDDTMVRAIIDGVGVFLSYEYAWCVIGSMHDTLRAADEILQSKVVLMDTSLLNELDEYEQMVELDKALIWAHVFLHECIREKRNLRLLLHSTLHRMLYVHGRSIDHLQGRERRDEVLMELFLEGFIQHLWRHAQPLGITDSPLDPRTEATFHNISYVIGLIAYNKRIDEDSVLAVRLNDFVGERVRELSCFFQRLVMDERPCSDKQSTRPAELSPEFFGKVTLEAHATFATNLTNIGLIQNMEQREAIEELVRRYPEPRIDVPRARCLENASFEIASEGLDREPQQV